MLQVNKHFNATHARQLIVRQIQHQQIEAFWNRSQRRKLLSREIKQEDGHQVELLSEGFQVKRSCFSFDHCLLEM